MYYYFYKITNNINGHFYYGVHTTNNLEDGYMGSGKAIHEAYKKYGIKKFKKEILKYFNNPSEMYSYEEKIVNEELVKSKNCYNLTKGGGCIDSTNKVAVKDKEGNILWVFRNDEKYMNKEYLPIWSGKHHRPESKEKIRKALTPPNSTNERIWVNKDGFVKYIPKKDIEEYIENGWERGRKGYKPRKGGRGITVFCVGEEFDDKLKNKEKVQKRKRNIKPAISKEELLFDMDNGLTIEESIKKHRLTRGSFFRYLRKYKIDKKEFGYKKVMPKEFQVSPKEIQEMIELLKIHQNYSKVGRIMGITDNAVRRRLKRRGYPVRIKELIEYLNKTEG